MSEFLAVVPGDYICILIGIMTLIVIIRWAKRNSEEFPFPAECFNCDSSSCRECTCLSSHKRHPHQHQRRTTSSSPPSYLPYGLIPVAEKNEML